MSTKPHSFLRGTLQFVPAVHIVQVETLNGSRIFRRVSLTAQQMAEIETQLMQLQHAGEIRSYLFGWANDASFPELVAWLDEIGKPAHQDELINIEQNTLFSGGAL